MPSTPKRHGATLHPDAAGAATTPLERILRRIGRTDEFPSISRYVLEINQKLSEDAAQSSASELANIILKDYALTSKLLKLVNSAFYGFITCKVTTVTRAVVVLGYDNVRMAAVSLLLFEHFRSRAGARDLKEAAVASFWCGLMAKEIARIQRDVDPEEAFICALLHQLGKLLTIYHLPKEYQEIVYHMSQEEVTEGRAAKQVLGISFDSLGLAVAKQWNFPESILKTLAPGNQEQSGGQGQADPLCVLTHFSNDLARIVATAGVKGRKPAVEALLERHGKHIALSVKQVETLIAASRDKLLSHADALQFRVRESSFLQQLSGQGGPDDVEEGGGDGQADKAYRLTDEQALCTEDGDLAGEDPAGIIMNGVQELASVMLGEYQVSDIAQMSLEITFRALQCQRALLFIHDARNQQMEARFGYGANIHQLVGRLRFKTAAADGDLFAQALRRGKDLVVADARDPKLLPLMPAWFRSQIDAQAFLFMPVLYQKVCVAAYYVDLDRREAPVDPQVHKHLSMLRKQLILAIKMAR